MKHLKKFENFEFDRFEDENEKDPFASNHGAEDEEDFEVLKLVSEPDGTNMLATMAKL
jgi:hypothetical protein